jgi:hypothetical protein
MEQWQKHGMTKEEWQEYEIEYNQYLDNIRFTGNTVRDNLLVQNAQSQAEHQVKKRKALNRIRELRRSMKEQAELNH